MVLKEFSVFCLVFAGKLEEFQIVKFFGAIPGFLETEKFMFFLKLCQQAKQESEKK